MGNGRVKVHPLERYHQAKLSRTQAVPPYWIPNLAAWCVAWDKLKNELIVLESQDKLIQRLGNDGSSQHLRKELSRYGAVRWDELVAFSKWPLKQYCRWQSPKGVWYVDCGNGDYCKILDDQCGIQYSTSNQDIGYALTIGPVKMADIIEAILGAQVLLTGVDENEAFLEDVEMARLPCAIMHKFCVHAGQRGIIGSAYVPNPGMNSEVGGMCM